MDSPRSCITGVGLCQRALTASQSVSSDGQHLYDAAREIVACVVEAATDAVTMSGLPLDDRTYAETWLSTFYGTGHVAEYYAAKLQTSSPTALNPRAFPLFCLNAVAATVSASLDLTGGAFTMIGLDAHASALGGALRSLRLHHHSVALYGAFDWPSSEIAQDLANRGVTTVPWYGAAALFVLEPEMSAERRGVPILGDVESLRRLPQADPGRRLVPGLAGLTAYAKELLEASRTHEPESLVVTS